MVRDAIVGCTHTKLKSECLDNLDLEAFGATRRPPDDHVGEQGNGLACPYPLRPGHEVGCGIGAEILPYEVARCADLGLVDPERPGYGCEAAFSQLRQVLGDDRSDNR